MGEQCVVSHTWDTVGKSRVPYPHCSPTLLAQRLSGLILSGTGQGHSPLHRCLGGFFFHPGRRDWRQKNRGLKYMLTFWGFLCSETVQEVYREGHRAE